MHDWVFIRQLWIKYQQFECDIMCILFSTIYLIDLQIQRANEKFKQHINHVDDNDSYHLGTVRLPLRHTI